jgi:hypothetical protein
MESHQGIKMFRIMRKLDDAKKELKELAQDSTFPLKESERDAIESAIKHIDNALNCL